MNVKTLLGIISNKDLTLDVVLFNRPHYLDNLVEVFESYDQVCLRGEISDLPSGENMTVAQLNAVLGQYPPEMDVMLFTENSEKIGFDSDVGSVCENGTAIQINALIN